MHGTHDVSSCILCRYSGKNEVLEGNNAAHIRAFYARGCILAHACHACKGEDLVAGTRAALKQIQEGLTMAKGSQRYSFLLYNGSVHFWKAARPLMRLGTWKELQEPLVALHAAVNGIEGHKAWKAQVAGALGQCLGEVRPGQRLLLVNSVLHTRPGP
jgi:hypothetical protein